MTRLKQRPPGWDWQRMITGECLAMVTGNLEFTFYLIAPAAARHKIRALYKTCPGHSIITDEPQIKPPLRKFLTTTLDILSITSVTLGGLTVCERKDHTRCSDVVSYRSICKVITERCST